MVTTKLQSTVAWIESHDAWADVSGLPDASTIHFKSVADFKLYLAGASASVTHEVNADHWEVTHDGIRFTACELTSSKRETVTI